MAAEAARRGSGVESRGFPCSAGEAIQPCFLPPGATAGGRPTTPGGLPRAW